MDVKRIGKGATIYCETRSRSLYHLCIFAAEQTFCGEHVVVSYPPHKTIKNGELCEKCAEYRNRHRKSLKREVVSNNG